MAGMPAEQTGESPAGEMQRALPTPFLTKTYQLVDDPAVDDLISWNEDGSGFIIWRPAEFARDLLPKYFKHNNLSSFVRQLNTYGFRKVVPDRWEFANDCFRKGEKGLLRDIQRRKMSQLVATSPAVTPAVTLPPSTVQLVQISPSNSGEEQMFSSTSSPGGTVLRQVINSTTPELVEENERLKKENEQMTNELSHLRGLCNNIFVLMSNYGPSGQQDAGNPSMESKQLDLLQSGRFSEEQGGSSGGGAGALDNKEVDEDTSPKLFGVSIGAKRMRRCEETESSERHQQQRADSQTENNNAQSDMKLEPSQSGPS
uniref:HSF-type DNA-binding domain-containing protein n=1 Tax=Kalanchoe fedtschenkoi TaxID=63787 RepID=A0A7N0SZ28_KALFE